MGSHGADAEVHAAAEAEVAGRPDEPDVVQRGQRIGAAVARRVVDHHEVDRVLARPQGVEALEDVGRRVVVDQEGGHLHASSQTATVASAVDSQV